MGWYPQLERNMVARTYKKVNVAIQQIPNNVNVGRSNAKTKEYQPGQKGKWASKRLEGYSQMDVSPNSVLEETQKEKRLGAQKEAVKLEKSSQMGM